ncbi:hypothetical protein ACEQPO_21220 [Bacillus sp. SL00103]
MGQFYAKNKPLLPKEILVPDSVDQEMIEQLLETNVHQPKKRKEKGFAITCPSKCQNRLKRKIFTH